MRSDDGERSRSGLVNARGEVKIALLALGALVLMGAGAAVLMMGGAEEETAPVEMDEAGFEQAYVGSDQLGEDGDEEPAVAIADEEELEPFDAETWDGTYRRMDEEEFREGFRRILEESEWDEFTDAVDEFELELTRALHQLDYEERRHFALNLDREMMSSVILEGMKEHQPEDYEEARRAYEYWLGEGIGQQLRDQGVEIGE